MNAPFTDGKRIYCNHRAGGRVGRGATQGGGSFRLVKLRVPHSHSEAFCQLCNFLSLSASVRSRSNKQHGARCVRGGASAEERL